MNKKIIAQFELLAKRIANQLITAKIDNIDEINRDTFRLKSVKRVLNILKGLNEEITSIDQLKGISGIGKGTIDRIQEILDNGYMEELKDAKDEIPGKKEQAVSELEEVIGIGKETAVDLVNRGIMSIKELKRAHKKGVVHLDDIILVGLKYHGVVQGGIPSEEITVFKKYAEKILKKIDSDLELVICGSYRRKKSTSGDIDMLIYHPDAKLREEVMNPKEYNLESYLEKFVNDLKKRGIILDDITNRSYKMKYMGFMQYKQNPVRRIDIRWMPYDSLSAGMLYFTGPYELNTLMRREAKKKGMILNEYGLYEIKKDGSKKVVPTRAEKDIFKKLGMAYLTPEQREYYNTGKK